MDTNQQDKKRDAPSGRRLLVISPWENRWSMGEGAGVSDDHHFIETLTGRGYEIHFVAPASAAPAEPQIRGLSVHTYPNFFRATERWPTPLRRLLWPLLFNLVVTPRTIAVGRSVKPDFILGHSHYSSFPCYAARKWLGVAGGVKLFGVMDLVHAEWSAAKYFRKNIEQIFALKIPQDVWIILDDGTRGREAAIRHGVPADRVRFLPNGIDVEWAGVPRDPAPARAELGIGADSVAALFLARLVPSKRPELFLRAAKIVLDRAPSRVVFVVAGDGPLRADCERLAEDLGLGANVRFTGTVAHEKVPSLMHGSDLFVSTSSLTNAAIPTCEAMICGLPAVGFDVGNTRDAIVDGETGLVIADGDVEALARAIENLAGDEPLRRRMGERAKIRAKEIFTGWDERIGQEIGIIEELVRSRAKDRG